MTLRIVVILSLFFSLQVNAAKIDKAFSALSEYNYFEAKKLFLESVKKYPSAANYGLSIIHFKTDNPFHNLDSSFQYILKAEKAYSSTKDKSKEKLKKYQFDYYSIAALREKISSEFFQLELKNLNEESLNKFQENHSWSQDRFKAIHLRDSLGLIAAEKINTSQAFDAFLKKYPESELKDEAQLSFYRAQYQEQTKANNLNAFVAFTKVYPSNPFVADAEDQIYKITTKGNKTKDYEAFIEMYPSNRNVNNAWRKLYQSFMSNFSTERIQQFKSTYPKYPFMDELTKESEMSLSVLLPFKKDGFLGYMNTNGEVVIPATYSTVGFFKDGLAWVEKNDKYGYINKSNELIIPLQFESAYDFEKGRAVVEINGKTACIDRSGAYILKPEFDDIGQLSEGLMFAKKDTLFGYYDEMGFQRIPLRFQEAYSFVNGLARVSVQNLEGVIDPYGAFVIKPQFEVISTFSDSLLLFEDGDYIKLVNKKGEIIPNLAFDDVGKLVNGRAYVEYDGDFGYIDAVGKLVIPMIYETYTNSKVKAEFSGNYAKVMKNGKYGIIDKSGKTIIPFAYTNLGQPGTLIAFEKAGKWGFIDISNKVVIEPTYENTASFSDGLGFSQYLTLFGAVNSKNEVIIPMNHTSISKLDKSHYLVTLGAKNGIYNSKGKLVVPIEYAQIRKSIDGFYILQKGLEIHYLSTETDELIQPKF
ncbi:MAG: WG repeat-containing protein [Fluviicola sp.]